MHSDTEYRPIEFPVSHLFTEFRPISGLQHYNPVYYWLAASANFSPNVGTGLVRVEDEVGTGFGTEH